VSAAEGRDRVAISPLLIAAACYLAVDLWIWHDVALHPASAAVGSNPSSDYQLMTWSLEWWPWAISHGLDPLFTNLVWAPHTSSTVWMTSIPGPALVAAPITMLFGPLVSYNLLMLLAPVLAALAAFQLCRVLTGSVTAALVAGYVFGFSPYVLGHAFSQHLDLVMVWPIPLLVLAAVRFIRGEIGTRGLVLRVVALLLFLLGSALELLATTVVLGAIVWGIAYVGAPALRGRLTALAWRLTAVGVVVFAVTVPFAWEALVVNHPPLPFAPERFPTDLTNLVLPTLQTVGGESSRVLSYTHRFAGNVGEQDGYLGIPLIVVCVLAAFRRRGRRTWIAAAALLIAVAWSLGPTLVVAGRTVANVPVSLARAPVFDMALPARIAVFASLAAAILAAEWLAGTRRVVTRAAVGVIIVASLLPQVAPFASAGRPLAPRQSDRAPFTWETTAVPHGFLALAATLPRGTNVLVVPDGPRATTGYWQAASGMRFRLAAGFTPIAPVDVVGDPVLTALATPYPPPLAVGRLRTFLARQNVQAIAMLPTTPPLWRAAIIAATRTSPRTVDGIGLIRVDPRVMGRLGTAAPLAAVSATTPASLSAPGIDTGSLTASTADSRVVAGWLQFDPASRSGVFAVAEGGPGGWADPAVLSQPGWEASSPDVASPEAGDDAAAVWIEARSGVTRLRVARTLGGVWAPLTPPAVGGVPSAPALAVSGDGTVVAAWLEQRGPRTTVRAAEWDPTGRLAGPFTLSGPEAIASPPAVVASPSPAVAWQETDATAAGVIRVPIGPAGPGRRTTLDWSADALLTPLGQPAMAGTVTVWPHGLGQLRAAYGPREVTLDEMPASGPGEGIRDVALRLDGGAVTIAWQRVSANDAETRAARIDGLQVERLPWNQPPGAVDVAGHVTIGPDGAVAAPIRLRSSRPAVLVSGAVPAHVLPARGAIVLTEDGAVEIGYVGPLGDRRIIARMQPLGRRNPGEVES
jgi:hypothetical protein